MNPALYTWSQCSLDYTLSIRILVYYLNMIWTLKIVTKLCQLSHITSTARYYGKDFSSTKPLISLEAGIWKVRAPFIIWILTSDTNRVESPLSCAAPST